MVSVRSDAVVVGAPLAAWVAELARLEICVRVPLEPLTPEQTALLVGHLVRARVLLVVAVLPILPVLAVRSSSTTPVVRVSVA